MGNHWRLEGRSRAIYNIHIYIDNVPHGRIGHSAKTPPKRTLASNIYVVPQQPNDLQVLEEYRIQLALQAIKQDATLSLRRAATIYNISHRTLSDRRARKPFRRDCAPNSMKLLKTEEEVIVKYVLNLNARGFPPRLAAVKDMADSLLAKRHRDPVGQN